MIMCDKCKNLMMLRHAMIKQPNDDPENKPDSYIGVAGVIMICKAFGVKIIKAANGQESIYVLSDVNGQIVECNQYSGKGPGRPSKG